MIGAALGSLPFSGTLGGDLAAQIAAQVASTSPNCLGFFGTDGVTSSNRRVLLDQFYVNPSGVTPVTLSSYATMAFHVRINNDGNVVSSSTGALHTWLFQSPTITTPSGVRCWRPQTNVVLLDGSSSPTITSSIFPGRVGTWLFGALGFGFDGGSNFILRHWIDGACFTRYKLASSGAATCGRAIPINGTGMTGPSMGGVDHQGGTMYAADWGIYEGGQPFAASLPSNNSPPSYVPPRILPAVWGNAEASFLASFDHTAPTFPDLSSGWTRGAGTRYYSHPAMRGNSVSGYAGASLVTDPYCPVGRFGDLSIGDVTDPVAGSPSWCPADRGSPGGANLLAFDLFRRPSDGSQGSVGPQTYGLQQLTGPNMGKCDPRSPYAGAQTWLETNLANAPVTPGMGFVSGRTGCVFYGYDNGAGGLGEIGIVKFADSGNTTAWTQNVGTANHFVYAKRSNTTDGRTVCVARYVDASNYIQLVGAGSDTIFLIDFQAGSNALGFGWIATPTNLAWRAVVLDCNGTAIQAYVDSASGVTLSGKPGKWELLTFGAMGSTYTDSTHGAGTRCGFGSPISTLQDPINDVVEWAAYTH